MGCISEMDDPVDSRLYQTILENAPTLIINADTSGSIIFSNRDDFNFTQEELKGKSIYDFIDVRYVDGFRKAIADTISTKVPQVYEFEDESVTGSRNWFRLRISPIVKDGVVDSIILISNSITEQIQFEEKLRDSEAKLRSIFNATLEGIILSDEEGNIVEWNKAQEDMFGLSRNEVLGKKLYDIQFNMISEEKRTPHRYENLKRSIETFLETGDAPWIHEVTEVEIEFTDGKEGIIQQFATSIKTSKGYSLCAFIHDITDRRIAEEEQAKSEKRYRSLFDQNNDGVVILDLDGKHIDFNKRTAEILGYTREELIGTTTDFTVIPEEQQESREQFKQVLDGVELPIYERRLKRKDGTTVPVEINVSLVRDYDGTPIYVQSILRDISKRKIVEQELKKSEHKWKQLAEQSIQGITIHQDTKVVYANPAYSRMVGRSIEEIYGMDVEQIWSIVHPEDREKRQSRFRDYHRTGMTSESSIYRIIRPDGEVRWMDSGVNVIDFGGRPAMQRTAIDVTDRMLAEHALIEQRDRAEMYLQLAGVIFIVLDREGTVTLINRKGTEVLGYEDDEIIGSSWFDTVLDEDRNNVKENFQKIIDGEIEQIEYVEREHVTKSGEKKLIAWHASVLRNSFGNIMGVISSGEDITEKRAAQLELRASQEMLQLVMNNIPQHVFWKDLSSLYMGCNDTFAEVFVQGIPEDVIGKSDYDLKIGPEDAEKFRRADKFALESENRRYDEIERTTLPNGEEAWFRVVKVPLHDGLGNDIGILGTLEDVTEKRNAELELIESETKLRTLVNSMNDLVFVFDENNKYRQFYAQKIEDLYVPPSEFLGRTVSEILPESVSLPFSESLNQVRESGIPVTFDYMLPDEKGERWFSASISLHEDGKSLVSVIRDITTRVDAARQIEEANRIINMSPTVAFLWKNTESWPVEYVSENVRDLFGYTAEEFTTGGVLYSDVVHPDDLERVVEEVQGFSADTLCESFVHEPYRIIRRDGEVRWITDDTVIRRNEQGEITHYQGVVTDITNRIMIMDVLRESETKYRTLIEQSLMGVVIIDSESREVVFANPLVSHHLGLPYEELISMNIQDLVQIIDSEYLHPATQFLENCMRGEIVDEIAVKIQSPKRSVNWILIDGNRIIYDGRDAVQLSIVDISERMEAQENLERERTSFRRIAEAAIRAQTTSEMGKLILQGLIKAMNIDNGSIRLYDEKSNALQPTAYVGLSDDASGHDAPVTSEGAKEWVVTKVALSKKPMIITDAKSDPRVEEYKNYLEELDIGSFIVYPLFNEKEELLGTFTLGARESYAISEDDRIFYDTVAELLSSVLERKKTEQAYQMSVRRYRDLLTDMSEGIGLISLDERFIFVNESFAKIVGFSRDELIGADSTSVIHPDDVGKIRAETEIRKQGTSSAYQVRMVRKDGDIRNVRISAIPSRDDEGNIEGTVAIITDITERVRAEREVRQLNKELAQRVEERTAELQAANKELESFAYSVSHDLRAPLRSIDGFSNAILEDYYDALDDTGKDYLTRIQRGATGMSNLIDAILNLSRVTRASMDRVDVNLSTLAHEAILELKEGDPEREMSVEIQDEIVTRCDKRLMRVVLQNLISNSWKFTKTIPSPRIEFGEIEEEGERVYYVKDNGVGFSMDDKEKLFKPFQRLHKADEFEGSGIGLATVERVIARHGGLIWAESQVGVGTTFYFTLKTTEII